METQGKSHDSVMEFLAKQLQLLTMIAALMLSFQFLGSLLLWLTFGLEARLKVQKFTVEIV